jgi:toxin CptA
MPVRRIEITPSPTLAIALCAVHLAAGAAVWHSALPLSLMSVSIGVIGAALGWSLHGRALLRLATAIVALEITAAGQISFLTRRGTWHACELLGTSYVSPRLTILNLRARGCRLARHVVLVPDSVDAQDFRRLRIWLRWAPRPEASRALTAGNDVPII